MDVSKATCAGCGAPMTVTRMACRDCDLVLEGTFEVPALARLTPAEQMFVIAFVRHHGSIKKVGSLFGVSYPTVKNRLNAIGAKLDASFDVRTPAEETLDRLSRGEISVDEALVELDRHRGGGVEGGEGS